MLLVRTNNLAELNHAESYGSYLINYFQLCNSGSVTVNAPAFHNRIQMMISIATPYSDWNYTMKSGPLRGASILGLVMLAVVRGNQEAIAALPRIMEIPDLNWNLPVLSASPSQGKTPLYSLMQGLRQGVTVNFQVLRHFLTKPELDWNVLVSGPGAEKGCSPLTEFMRAAQAGNLSVQANLDSLIGMEERLHWQQCGIGAIHHCGAFGYLVHLVSQGNDKAMRLLNSFRYSLVLPWFHVGFDPVTNTRTNLFSVLLNAGFSGTPMLKDLVEELLNKLSSTNINVGTNYIYNIDPLDAQLAHFWISLSTHIKCVAGQSQDLSLQGYIPHEIETLAQSLAPNYPDVVPELMLRFYAHLEDKTEALRWYHMIPKSHPHLAEISNAFGQYLFYKLTPAAFYTRNIDTRAMRAQKKAVNKFRRAELFDTIMVSTDTHKAADPDFGVGLRHALIMLYVQGKNYKGRKQPMTAEDKLIGSLNGSSESMFNLLETLRANRKSTKCRR